MPYTEVNGTSADAEGTDYGLQRLSLVRLIYKALKFNLFKYRFSAGDTLVLTGPT